MPTYQYRCDKCESEFEFFQNMVEDPLDRCILCGKPGVKRLIGPGAGIIFKGSGFYCTDYRKDGGNSKTAKEGKDSESNPENSPETAKKDDKKTAEVETKEKSK